jgi:hypothetical protein
MTWPAEITALERRIALLEIEASYAICGVARAERLRLEAKRLTVQLEAMKQAALDSELAAA